MILFYFDYNCTVKQQSNEMTEIILGTVLSKPAHLHSRNFQSGLNYNQEEGTSKHTASNYMAKNEMLWLNKYYIPHQRVYCLSLFRDR